MFRSILLAAGAAIAVLACDAAAARPLNQHDLVGLDRVSDAHVSPDGRWAVYDLATLRPDGSGRAHSVWLVPTDASAQAHKLVDGATPRWDGNDRILYLSDGQVWRTCVGCASPKPQKVTDLPLEVGSFRVAPDGSHLVVSLAVFPDADDPAATKARLAARAKGSSGRVYDRIFVRHWDEWADGTRNHLFSIPLKAGAVAGPPRALAAGFDGDTPSKPFGDDGEYAISPDGKTVVFSVRIAGKSEPWSTNFDLYRAPIDGSAKPENLTAGNAAWDGGPVFAPDGRLVWRAMKRPTFEADRFGVMTFDGAGKAREIDPAWDRSAEQIAVSGDGRAIYVLAEDVQHAKLFAMDVTGQPRVLTGDGHVTGFDVAHPAGGDVIVYTRDAFDEPGDVYALKPGGQPVRLTHANQAKLAGVDFSPAEPFSFQGWNGETVHGWVTRPAGWRPGQRYPTVLMIHGGPQGAWDDAWSFRWNPQVWAGWGYAVVNIDPHGSTGYGQDFTDAVSGHWGDRPLEDFQKGWSTVLAKYPWIDGDRACAAGASYGGFMVYWMAGVWNTPWKCLIDHDGVFDNRIMGYATEELWFAEWENGHATPWQDPAAYDRFNPVNHVADWTKPMLVIHSDRDFRIPLDQGLGAFTAMQRKGVPSRFLTFPDENHWVLKPKNSLLWHDTIQAWLDQWIGAGAKAPQN